MLRCVLSRALVNLDQCNQYCAQPTCPLDLSRRGVRAARRCRRRRFMPMSAASSLSRRSRIPPIRGAASIRGPTRNGCSRAARAGAARPRSPRARSLGARRCCRPRSRPLPAAGSSIAAATQRGFTVTRRWRRCGAAVGRAGFPQPVESCRSRRRRCRRSRPRSRCWPHRGECRPDVGPGVAVAGREVGVAAALDRGCAWRRPLAAEQRLRKALPTRWGCNADAGEAIRAALV